MGESGGQPAEPPPEVSAAPDWLDPAAQSHTQTPTHTHSQNEKVQRRAHKVTVKHLTYP